MHTVTDESGDVQFHTLLIRESYILAMNTSSSPSASAVSMAGSLLGDVLHGSTVHRHCLSAVVTAKPGGMLGEVAGPLGALVTGGRVVSLALLFAAQRPVYASHIMTAVATSSTMTSNVASSAISVVTLGFGVGSPRCAKGSLVWCEADKLVLRAAISSAIGDFNGSGHGGRAAEVGDGGSKGCRGAGGMTGCKGGAGNGAKDGSVGGNNARGSNGDGRDGASKAMASTIGSAIGQIYTKRC